MLLFSIFIMVLMGFIAFARQSRVDVEPKRVLTTYDYVPDWVDCEDIVEETHPRTCALEEAILTAPNSTSMVYNICYVLAR